MTSEEYLEVRQTTVVERAKNNYLLRNTKRNSVLLSSRVVCRTLKSEMVQRFFFATKSYNNILMKANLYQIKNQKQIQASSK